MYRIERVNGKQPHVAALIDEMHDECFPGYEQHSLSMTGHWWIARDEEDDPVAFAALWASVRHLDTGYLARSGVIPEHRGQGLQARLIRCRELHARGLGWQSMISDTVEGNITSANNLIKAGYKLWLPPERWATSGSLYWRKVLVKGVG